MLNMLPSSKTKVLCSVGICIATLVNLTYGISRPSTIVFENNGFTNVVIAIHESVTEDKALIHTLKDEMTKASKILYVATKQRAYLNEIKILLPSTWSNDASYQTPTKENLAFADVIITDPIRGKRSLPQTRSYDGCGKQGVHVLLTKEFLTTPRADPYLMNPAKFFVHAFAQFRWGVFQEYAEEGENVFYMSPSTGQPEAIRCTFSIRGLVQKNDTQHTICYSHLLADRQHVVASIDEKTGLYHSDCQWRPYPNHQRTKASIMDHQFIQELVTFCGDDPKDYSTIHNYEAPSKHNRLCGHKSTWGVITETDDFSSGKNPPKNMSDEQLIPTFTVMRATSRKRRAAVLIDPVLIKESQQDFAMKRALGHLRHELSKTDTELHILDNEMESGLPGTHNSSLALKDNLPLDNDRFGKVVTDTLKGFKHDDENENHLIVVTETFTESHMRLLTEGNGLKVSLISYNATDILNDQHEGFDVQSTGQTLGHTLLDRLRHVLRIEPTNTVVVLQQEYNLLDNEQVTGSVDIDRTLGSHISFIFHFEESRPYINITSPSGVIYGQESTIYSSDFDCKVIHFHFQFVEAGTWKYTMSQSSMMSQTIHVTITSEDVTLKEDPVVIRQSAKFADGTNSSLLLHVDATQGSYPLLGFNVTAKIEKPNGHVETLQLFDNGAGADILKNDGIYSRIYLAPELGGSYHVTFVITGKAGQVVRREETFMIVNNDYNQVKKSVETVLFDGTIQRQISGGTIYLKHEKYSDVISDVIPPARVTDLKAFTYLTYRNTIVLKWTAPGDDHDHGHPTAYELFIGCGVKDVRFFLQFLSTGSFEGQEGDIVRETFTAIANGTETEMFLWNMKDLTKSYIFAIRALDKIGNKGQFSNIATAGPVSLRRK